MYDYSYARFIIARGNEIFLTNTHQTTAFSLKAHYCIFLATWKNWGYEHTSNPTVETEEPHQDRDPYASSSSPRTDGRCGTERPLTECRDAFTLECIPTGRHQEAERRAENDVAPGVGAPEKLDLLPVVMVGFHLILVQKI